MEWMYSTPWPLLIGVALLVLGILLPKKKSGE